jgi:hypothetical protein
MNPRRRHQRHRRALRATTGLLVDLWMVLRSSRPAVCDPDGHVWGAPYDPIGDGTAWVRCARCPWARPAVASDVGVIPGLKLAEPAP